MVSEDGQLLFFSRTWLTGMLQYKEETSMVTNTELSETCPCTDSLSTKPVVSSTKLRPSLFPRRRPKFPRSTCSLPDTVGWPGFVDLGQYIKYARFRVFRNEAGNVC